MSRRSKRTSKPWTAEEDSFLVASWPDTDIDLAAIAERLSGSRSVEGVRLRGHKIGLGKKARRKKADKVARDLKQGPDDTPAFEDHPDADAPGPRSKAARLGSRFGTVTQDLESSRAGSSLDGAAFHPTGRRV